MSGDNWGVAFSGGGQLGFAHIGIIRALTEKHIKPVAIAGTSAGSIFGSFWACGRTAEEMATWAQQLETRQLLDFYFSWHHLARTLFQLLRRNPLNLPLPPGIFRGEKFYDAMKELLGDNRVKDAGIPLAIPAVDLDTGEEVLFSNHPRAAEIFTETVMPATVKLVDAVRASIGVPGVFAPWRVAGRRLVDGGLADNLPLRRLPPLGAEKIIAADVGESIPYHEAASESLVGILERSVAVLTRQLVQSRHTETDILIDPDLPQVIIGDFRFTQLLIENGYHSAREALDSYL